MLEAISVDGQRLMGVHAWLYFAVVTAQFVLVSIGLMHVQRNLLWVVLLQQIGSQNSCLLQDTLLD